VFTKNRERLLEGDIARGFNERHPSQPGGDAVALDRALPGGWHADQDLGQHETHASTTDPDARLYCKARGQAAKLCYMGHLLMENRNGLVVDTETTHATGTAEREAAEARVGDIPGCRRITLGSDKAYDVAGHVATLREMNVTPHVAQNTTNRASARKRVGGLRLD
jgi:hypothetical protein